MFKRKVLILLCFLFSLSKNSISCEKEFFGTDFKFSVSNIHELIETNKVRCSQVINFFLQRVYAYNKDLNALISINPNAMIEALDLDKFYKEKDGLVGNLHCVPILIKDNIDVKNLPTSGGIRALRHSVPNQDAAIVRKLRKNGAIIIAKTNLAELGLGTRYTSEMGDKCRNPFDLSRTCGASSSGVGAGIASGMALIGIGTDTDASILNPSANCGLFGLRLAQVETDLDGVIPFFKYQDVVGPITNNIDDMELVYSVLISNSNSYQTFLNSAQTKSGFKVAILKNFFDSFEFNTTSLGFFEIDLDEKFKSKILTALRSLNQTVDLIEYEISPKQLDALLKLLEELTLARLDCQTLCTKLSMNEYFGQSCRFDVDAPYRNFEIFFKSSILNPFWKDFFAPSNISNENEACKNGCVLYEKLKLEMVNFTSKLFTYSNADILIYPTINALPLFLNNSSDNSIVGTFLSTSTGYPSLNVPIASLDGFPLSVSLLARSENTTRLLHFAKYIEEKLYKFSLPKSTPLIRQKECNVANKIFKEKIALKTIIVINLLFILEF